MKRLHQILLIGTIIPFSWLMMMVVHEFGHVVGAWITGGSVLRVILRPLELSRTDLALNPHPFIVAAAGPLFGILFPLIALGIAHAAKSPGIFMLRFFTAICCIVNGAYIGLGSFDAIGDAGDLLVAGASKWQLWLFGICAIAPGIYLLNGLGPKFGFGTGNGVVNPRAAYVSMGLLFVLVALEMLFS